MNDLARWRTFSPTSKACLCGTEPGRRTCPMLGRAPTLERIDRKRRTGPTDSRTPTETNLAGRPSEIKHTRCRRLSRYDVHEMLVRLDNHGVFNQLGDFTTEGRRVRRRLSREVYPVGVAREDHAWSVRTRTPPSPAGAPPLKPGQVDGVPSCNRRPLAPGGAVLTAVES